MTQRKSELADVGPRALARQAYGWQLPQGEKRRWRVLRGHGIPHRPPLRATQGRRPQGARHVRDGGRSRLRDGQGHPASACRQPAPTSSSSACRSPIPWPTVPRCRPHRCARSRPGHTMQRTLELVRAFRVQDQDTPIVLMGYYNPDLRLSERALPRRSQGGRSRRPHHRRRAARGG